MSDTAQEAPRHAMALSTPSADVPALRETVGRRPVHRGRVPDAPYRLVVVSNRVASAHKSEASTGGLANAVLAALKQSGGIWFGWNGDVADDDPGPPAIEESGGITYATTALSRVDYDEYYAGFANRVLWPLFHYRPSLVEYKRQELESYLRVNRSFADKLLPLLKPGDLIWVHDYHLIPLGQQL